MGNEESQQKKENVPQTKAVATTKKLQAFPQLQTLSDFSPAYIIKLKEKFEKDQMFTMKRDDLKKFFQCSERETDILMQMLDLDGDKTIDSHEFVCALGMLAHGTMDQKATLIFSLYDKDKSGMLEMDEMSLLLNNSLTMIGAMDGKKTRPAVADVQNKAEQIFRDIDKDSNKKISLKEFKNYIKRDPQILKVLVNNEVVELEDLGTDFGAGDQSVPCLDEDLDEECNPSGLQQSEKNNKAKEGLFDLEEIGEADQFMATKPWAGTIKNQVPTDFKPSKSDGMAPDANLELEYVFGYRCHDVRNNLFYTHDQKQLVYHCAALGVVYDRATNEQTFFREHNDDIHCLAVHPTKPIVATGQIGRRPRLCVWDYSSKECIMRVTAPLTMGIKTLAFSPDGKYLAASALDDKHEVAVWDWEAPSKAGQPHAPIAHGNGSRANILSLGFNPASNQIIATCVKEVVFMSFSGGVIKGKKGSGWGNTGGETTPSQAFVGDTLFTGLYSGEIAAWSGTSLSKRNKAHGGRVNSLYSSASMPNKLLSGGHDGLVILWAVNGTGLTQEKQFSLKEASIRSMNPAATSCSMSPSGDKIAVGTRGGEIVEFNVANDEPTVYLRSHFDDELWGLAVHPHKAEVYTFGRDGLLGIWDLKSRRQLKYAKLDTPGDVLAFSNQGKYFVLGLLNGQFIVLDSDLKAVTKRADRRGKAIQCIKFSPNDAICAVGAHDQAIFTYDVAQKFKPLKKMRGSSSTIEHMDFSLDGSQLMIQDKAYEVLFYNVETGKQNTSGASGNRNEQWACYTCCIGWGVQGIWQKGMDGSDVNAVCRSNDNMCLASADDFGFVNLYKWPSPVDAAACNKNSGHSSHVTNVAFSKNEDGQKYLVSTGGEDKCIFQWKYKPDVDGFAESAIEEADQSAPPFDDGYAMAEQSNSKLAEKEAKTEKKEAGAFDMEDDIEEGDQAQNINIVALAEYSRPDNFSPLPNHTDAPEENLVLEHAHGFRSFDTRGNLAFTSEDKICWTTAGVGVVSDNDLNQSFFNQHHEDIVSMALHPDGDIVATGQMAAKGVTAWNKGKNKEGKLVNMMIWKASTQELICEINGFHRRAIRHLEFSKNGTKLLSVGEDDYHSVAIYDWTNRTILASSKVDGGKIYGAAWKDDNEFTVVGDKVILTFTLSGGNLNKVKRPFIQQLGSAPNTCCGYVEGSLYTGNQKAMLCLWNGNSPKKLAGHKDVIWQIKQVKGTKQFISGDNGGKILVWTHGKPAPDLTLDLSQPQYRLHQPGLRSIDASKFASQQKLLVGTRGSDVMVINQKGDVEVKLVQGHAPNVGTYPEVWGLTSHPTEQIFATCGADGTVRMWSPKGMIMSSKKFASDPTAISWSYDGKFIAVGDRKGDAYLLNVTNLEPTEGKISAKNAPSKAPWIEVIMVSPDSRKICFGAHGGRAFVELGQVDGQLTLKRLNAPVVIGHTAITQMDWSMDGNFLAVNAGEPLYFNMSSRKQEKSASSVSNTEWMTRTCIFGWGVQGIWQGIDYTDINSTCRSQNQKVVATGDDFGRVNMFRWPSVQERSKHKTYNGHSSHVTKVRFSAGDNYLLSTGGGDCTVFVWKTDFGVDDAIETPTNRAAEYAPHPDDPDNEGNKEDKSRSNKVQTKSDNRAKEQAATRAKVADDEGDFNLDEDMAAGDEFMAIRPWKGAIKEPTGFKRPPANQDKAPQVSIEPEWVYGYRGSMTKNNLGILKDGSFAYFAAGLGISMTAEGDSQRFFDMHTDDITGMGFSPDQVHCVTGENGRKPVAYIWDGLTMQKKHKLVGNGIVRSIMNVAFSPSGNRVAIVDQSDDHNIAVYDANSGAIVAKSKGDRAKILELAFQDDTTFASAGSKHFKMWTVAAGTLKSRSGSFKNNDQRIGGVVFNGNTALTGSITGEVYKWNGGSIIGGLKNHSKLVDAITVHGDNLYTGGRDSKIFIYDKTSYAIIGQFDLTQTLPSAVSCIPKGIAIGPDGSMFIGTFGHEIIKVDPSNGQEIQMMTQGHYAPKKTALNEAWGLDITGEGLIHTCSEDGTVRCFDTIEHKMNWYADLNKDATGKSMPMDPATKDLGLASQAKCVASCKEKNAIAVGMCDGSLRIYENGALVYCQKVAQPKEFSEDIKFSPDMNTLILGSHDNKLYKFDISQGFKTIKAKKFGKSSSFITHFDFSADSQCLRTTDGSYELLFYDLNSCQQNPSGASAYRDTLWATQSCVLGWGVQGIWQGSQDGSDINACDYTLQPVFDLGYQLVATGDDDGMVKLFRYPCCIEEAKSVVGRGHSSHVMGVKLAPDGSKVWSIGGNDTAIIQWKVQKA